MRRYRGPITDHFDGTYFYNPYYPNDSAQPPRRWEVLRWLATRKIGPWQEWTESEPGPPPPDRVQAPEFLATFVGHSSMLLQLDGFNILCDPHWSQRASPLGFIGPRRHRAPGVKFEDLPAIDLVLISHDHYDHFDLPTLRCIAEKWNPHFVAPLGVRSRLKSHGIAKGSEITELDWWQMVSISPQLTVMSVPARHFSGRGLADRNRTLWSGYVLQSSFGTIFFGGDTAYGPHFAEIKRRLPPIRVAFLPIGAYKPRWFMAGYHLSPEEALRAHADLGAETSIGIHFGTFALADDGQQDPLDELQCALDSASEPKPQFCTLTPGESKHFAPELTTAT